MGMFGNKQTWQTIGAALQDIGDIRGGGPGTAVRNLQAMRKEQEAKRQREAYMMQFGELLGGQSVGEAPMTPGIDGSLEGMGPQAMPTAPQLPDQAAIIRSLMTAPEGVDQRALMALYEASKPPAPQAPIRASAGDVFIDPVTRQVVYSAPDKPERLPVGFVRGPDGSLMIDPGYLRGQQQLSSVKRAPPRPKAAPRVQSMSNEQLLAALKGAK